ncbi:hypothetical protein J6590_096569 [Homalodisca vitripennis]|nr:hypothetical protein J6590_096569 [Homalodisca vitripennis]
MRCFMTYFTTENTSIEAGIRCGLREWWNNQLISLTSTNGSRRPKRIIRTGQVKKSLLSARHASQIGEFDNKIKRWGEVNVPYLPS